VIARRVEDLVIWQLANELRERIYALTSIRPAIEDRKFCEQIRDAVGSISRNIAEGFGRYRPKEHARFLVIARGSLFEVEDLLRDGAARGHWSAADVQESRSLCNRCIAAVTSLIRYLRTQENVDR
jgi:four helix bundle protein